jgi:bacteriorhodopsin
MNLETCISIVAGYYYSIFITKVNDSSKEVDWDEITKLRYIEWSITTPLMLVTLCIVLAKNSKELIHFTTMSSIVVLNYLMLGIGYYGVIHPEHKLLAMVGGFIPFFAMFYLIFVNYCGNKLANKILFFIYFVVWSMYGVVYMFSEVYKNVWMNVLDLTAKCFIGIGLWVYYSKIINKF